MRSKLAVLVLGVFLISLVCAVSDTAVFQGQYYVGEEFQQGTYEFKFDIYTGEIFGELVYTETENLTTGTWGQWRTELTGISAACNDTTKDYFMEITIDGDVQSPRRRLTHFNYLRKDVDETTTGDLTISNILNFVLGGLIQESVDSFLISKSLGITGNLNVQEDANITGVTYVNELKANEANITEIVCDELKATSEVKVGGIKVCLEDGTNCQVSSFTDTNCSVDGSCALITYDSELSYTVDTNVSTICIGDQVLLGDGTCISSSTFGSGGSGTSYASFVSTVDGTLGRNDVYLSLGTDSGIAASSSESSWIIGRDMTITGILWNAASNDRTKTSAITLLKSTTNKASFSATTLSKDIQGVASGIDNTFSVSLSQGDLVAIKYESGGTGGSIDDLSITLIGTYN